MVARLHADDFLLYSDVVRLNSFTAAAKANDLTPAAVSKRISQFENHLGVTLLHRSTRHLAMTEEGQLLYDYAQQLRFEVGQAKEIVLKNHKEMQGNIRVKGSPMFVSHVLTPLIAKFVLKHPKISFELETDPKSPTFYGQYDIVFDFLDADDKKHALGKPRQHIMVASPEYIKSAGMPKKVVDFKKHRCVVYGYRFLQDENVWVFAKQNKRVEINVTPSVVAKTSRVLVDMALSGAGVALIPLGVAEAFLESGELLHVMPELSSESPPVQYSHPYENAFMPERLKVFLEELHGVMD